MNNAAAWDSVFSSKEAIKALRDGTREATEILNNTPREMLGEGNPNHPRYDMHLFGEHVDTFMARQYKCAA